MIEVGPGFLFGWDDLVAVRREVEARGVPDDPDDVRARFVRLVANAEGLRVLFGGTPDASAVRECREALAAIREHARWEAAATAPGTATRQ